MKKILFTALLALMYMGHASADPHTFENGNIKAVINKDNGVLESLVNKNTGWDAVSPGDFGDKLCYHGYNNGMGLIFISS